MPKNPFIISVFCTIVGFLTITLQGCNALSVTVGDSIKDNELEEFFKKHTVNGNRAVALKKRSLGGVSYLATIHGYRTNHSVCEEIIAPYNKDSSKSVIGGEYFCEDLK